MKNKAVSMVRVSTKIGVPYDKLAADAKDPDAGSTWEEVEGRIRARLRSQSHG